VHLDPRLNPRVSSVSRHPAKLAAAAAQLQVGPVNASQWAIRSHGLNHVLGSRLRVMIKGRRVYTPLLAGVSRDVQDSRLADAECVRSKPTEPREALMTREPAAP
jgi:iron complex outermembrane receptor protein